jgi:hypothetical protein
MNRREEVVAAKVSSWAAPQDSAKLFATLAAFDTVAAELGS